MWLVFSWEDIGIRHTILGLIECLLSSWSFPQATSDRCLESYMWPSCSSLVLVVGSLSPDGLPCWRCWELYQQALVSCVPAIWIHGDSVHICLWYPLPCQRRVLWWAGKVHVAGEPVWPYHLCYSKLGFGVRAECMPGTCSVVVQIIELSACLRVTFPFFRWSGWWWPRQGPCKLFRLAFHFCRCACRLTTSLTLTYWPYPDLSRTKSKYFILFCDTVIRMARSVSR